MRNSLRRSEVCLLTLHCPRLCLLWEEGGIARQRVCQLSDVLWFPVRRRHICASEAHIVWLSFSHILFLLCLKCSMTLCPWQSVLRSNRASANRICLASFPFFNVCLFVSNQWKVLQKLSSLVRLPQKSNGLSLFPSDCCKRLCSNG